MVEDYNCNRQLKVCTNSKFTPEIPMDVTNKEKFHKNSLCCLDRSQFRILKRIFVDVLLATLVLYVSSVIFIWYMAEFLRILLSVAFNIEIVVSCIFIATVISFRLVEEMPLKLYDAFELKKYEYNKNAARYFVIDHIKRFVIILAFVIPIAAATVFAVQRSGQYCFITILAIWTGFFDRYAPLAEGVLKRSIGNLAASLNFLLTELYIIGDFKRLAHHNVFLHVLWNFEQILHRDTLKDKDNETQFKEEERGKDCTDENHVGHCNSRHFNMISITMLVHLLMMSATFSYILRRYGPHSGRFSWKHKKRSILMVLLVIVIYVMESYHVLAEIGVVTLWQGFEYRKLAFSERMCGNLIKVYLNNLKFPTSDWNYTHHMLSQDLNRLEELEEAKKTK